MKRFREKDQYSYSIEVIDGEEHFIVKFVDGCGITHEISVNREVFCSLQELSKEENHQAYLIELYISHFTFNGNDDKSAQIDFCPLHSPERSVLNSEAKMYITEILKDSTDAQRRRFLMYYVDNYSFREIAKIEECSFQVAQRSVIKVKKKFAQHIYFKKGR